MALKRGRGAFEADLRAQQSPFVSYGTPLPPLDPDARDDGSYVPIWKQEVVDERGRKRLHGAFTGGFSAGYFNTVGSKEGWTPAAFVSSRSNKRNNDGKNNGQRPEDFMDEEDLADAAEAQALQTTQSYSGLGSTEGDEKRKGLLMDVFKSDEDTIGFRLLRKMGWRDGQGLGAKLRRSTRLDDGVATHEKGEEHQFAPADTSMIMFTKKDDRKGLGYNQRDLSLTSLKAGVVADLSDDDQSDSFHVKPQKTKLTSTSKMKGGIGMGVLNDDGSDDEDPYTMGPKISYNRIVGGERKKKEKTKTLGTHSAPLKSANPLLPAKPVFISRRTNISKPSLRKCHDGRLPITGFVLSDKPDSTLGDWETRYPRPNVPNDWISSKSINTAQPNTAPHLSTAEMARSSQLDAKARAGILGEQILPGKSVFDFISPAARDKLVAASGKSTLPIGRGERPPKNYAQTLHHEELVENVPSLSKDVAIAALGRGLGGWMPYADDESKRSRYRAFLEFAAELRTQPPNRPPEIKRDDWGRELQEFAHAAEVFKPMTGKMASRFTTSSASAASLEDRSPNLPSLLSTPSAKPEDAAETAAKMGMFGPLTRSTHQFYPTRILCKRFNIKLPANVQPDSSGAQDARSSGSARAGQPSDLLSKVAMVQLLQDNGLSGRPTALLQCQLESSKLPEDKVEIDVSKNDALEAAKAGDAVFKAIFGDDDSDA